MPMNAAPREVAEALASDPHIVAAMDRIATGDADERHHEATARLMADRLSETFGALPEPADFGAIASELAPLLARGCP